MLADLHCHTKISDGSTSIDDLILLAKKRRIDVISVTDHDTLAGVTRAKVLGDRFGVNVIPGAEFSCYDYSRNCKVHLLGYMFRNPDRMEGLCRKISDSRKAATTKCLQKVMRFYPITAEMVTKAATGSSNIFKQHIMLALMHAGYANTVFGPLYDRLFSRNGGSCYVEPEYPDVHEVLKLLQSAGAVTVVAHPVLYGNVELIEELAQEGLDGIEVWTPKHNEQDSAMLLELAKSLNLLTTGGSDFHGMYARTPVPIATCTTPEECLEALYDRSEKINKR